MIHTYIEAAMQLLASRLCRDTPLACCYYDYRSPEYGLTDRRLVQLMGEARPGR